MSDPAWLDLTGNDRATLCCLWLEYASSRCRLRADTRSLTRQLNLRVTNATLERLNHAGYIDIVASATLAEGYHNASPRAHVVEVETEIEEEIEEPKEHPPYPNPVLDVPHRPEPEEFDDLPVFDFEGILKDLPL
jgi:hypothetical protein